MRRVITIAAMTTVAILVVACCVAPIAYLDTDHDSLEAEHIVYRPTEWSRMNAVVGVGDGYLCISMLLTDKVYQDTPRWNLRVDVVYGNIVDYDVDRLEMVFNLDGTNAFIESMDPSGRVTTSTSFNDPTETRSYDGWCGLDSAGVTWTFSGSDTRSDPGTISGSGPTFRANSDDVMHVDLKTTLVSQGFQKDTIEVHWTADVFFDAWGYPSVVKLKS